QRRVERRPGRPGGQLEIQRRHWHRRGRFDDAGRERDAEWWRQLLYGRPLVLGGRGRACAASPGGACSARASRTCSGGTLCVVGGPAAPRPRSLLRCAARSLPGRPPADGPIGSRQLVELPRRGWLQPCTRNDFTPKSDLDSLSVSTTLHQLAEEYWEGVLRRNPILATFYGDHRYDDQLPDVSASARAAEQQELRAILERLNTIDLNGLELEDHITASMLRLAIDASLESSRLRLDELGVDQMEGPQVWLPELLNWHPSDTAERIQQLIARYRAFPRFMGQYLENLRDGVRDGRTAPWIAVERVTGQIEALLAKPPAESPLAGGGRLAAPELGRELPAVAEESVYPAYPPMLPLLRHSPP